MYTVMGFQNSAQANTGIKIQLKFTLTLANKSYFHS